jgi:hypothetical protein
MEASGQLHTPAALLPGKEPLVPVREEAGRAPEPFERGGEEKKMFLNMSVITFHTECV